MSGVLRCVVDGRVMVLERTGKRTGAPMSQFSAWYEDTGEAVPGLTGDNVGVALLGIEREVFLRSGFIGGAGMAVTQTPELERRIAALVSSGEDTSFSEPFAQLNTWKNRRKHNKTGLLPETLAQLDQVEQALRQAEQSKMRMEQEQNTLQATEQRQREVEEKLRRWHAVEQQAQREKYQAARKAWAEEQERLETLCRIKDRLPSRDALHQGQVWGRTLLTQLPLMQQKEAQLEQTNRILIQRKEQAKTGVFKGAPPAEAKMQAQEAAARCEALEAVGVFPPWMIGLIVFLAFVIAAAVAVLIMQEAALLKWCALFAGVLSAGGMIFLLWYRRKKQKEADKERDALFQTYRVKTPADLLEQAEAYEQYMAETDRMEQRFLAAEETQKQAAARLTQMENQLFQLTAPFAPEARTVLQASEACSRGLETWSLWEQAQRQMKTLQVQVEAVSSGLEEAFQTGETPVIPPLESKQQLEEEAQRLALEKTRCQESIAMAKGEQAVGGEAEVLLAHREMLLARRETLEEEYHALVLAREVLEEANRELQSRFSPALNEKASRWMARLTGGKYQDLRLDKAFSAQTRTEGDPISRSALMLSAGTLDQLYLAVRLAICDLVLPEPYAVPLVLDDALIRFDDARLQFALDGLYELAAQRQILLFTCHSREGTYLRTRENVHFMQEKTKLEEEKTPQNAAEWSER